MTAPVNGAIVAGPVIVAANATDRRPQAVQFKLDGTHKVASDAAGNAATRGSVSVTVDNDPAPSYVLMTAG
jgi:hypothetical protein